VIVPALDLALTGVVYVARGEGRDRVKIGYTMQLRERMRRLRCKPIMTIAAGPDVERFLHTLFEDQRIDGEWFAVDGRLSDFLAIVEEGEVGELRQW
jgi:hypothetical protein